MDQESLEKIVKELMAENDWSLEKVLEEVKRLASQNVISPEMLAELPKLFKNIQASIAKASAEMEQRSRNGTRRTTGVIRLPL